MTNLHRAVFILIAFNFCSVQSAATCDNDCTGSEFCGLDGSCHSITCENMYTFGMEDWYGDSNLPDLYCENQLDGVRHIKTTLGKFGTGTSPWFPIEYSCSTTGDDAERVEQKFTRYCEAIPKIANTHFHCNELAQNTSFDDFLSKVETLQCSGVGSYKRNSSIKNEVRMSNLSPDQTATYQDVFGAEMISDSFTPPDNVVIVVYEIVTETASPTFTPTHSLAPSTAPTSSASALCSSSLLLAMMLLTVLG